MTVAPTPNDVYRRAIVEGDRRLSASTLELVATGFNAGFTIVFGVAALGIVHALVEPELGRELARVAGAAAFGIGLVALIVSRSELFTENFFDPVATAFARGTRPLVGSLLRLWTLVLALNLVGLAILLAILSVDGVMPPPAEEALRGVAEEIVAKPTGAALASALVGGALVTLLSFLLQAVDSVVGRILVAYLIGFLLAVGPFAHVAVTVGHLLFDVFNGGTIAVSELLREAGLATVGNLVGGLGFVTLTHIAQARAEST